MIEIQDDAERVRACEERGEPFVPWDSDELRPSGPGDPTCRLVSHDPDPDNEVTLWPERLDRQQLEVARRTANDAQAFLQSYMCLCRDDDAAWCKSEWIERCKRLARDKGVHGLVGAYKGPFQTFTGVDLAFSERDKSDDTAFFTFAVRSEDGFYQILDIDIGNWDAMTIIQKLLLKIRTFRSFAAVENNGTQEFLIQIARSMDIELPIRSHNTTAQGKAHPWQGVAAIFYEMGKGKWLIPSQKDGRTSRPVEKFVEACLGYTPTRHTADILMASFVARALAFKLGAMVAGPSSMGTPGRSQLTQERRAMMR